MADPESCYQSWHTSSSPTDTQSMNETGSSWRPVSTDPQGLREKFAEPKRTFDEQVVKDDNSPGAHRACNTSLNNEGGDHSLVRSSTGEARCGVQFQSQDPVPRAMVGGDTQLFAQELETILDALRTQLNNLHAAVISDSAAKNAELITLNKELQAQLGQASPLPAGCSYTAPQEDSGKKSITSLEKEQEQEPSVLPGTTEDTTEDASCKNSSLEASNKNSSLNSKANLSSAKSRMSVAASCMTSGFGHEKFIPEVALRKCWENKNRDSVEAASTRFSVKVATRSLRHSESIGPLHDVRHSSYSRIGAVLTCLPSLSCEVMHPVGQARMVWNGICLVFIAYDLLIVPLQVFDIEQTGTFYVFEWFLTVWWSMDVIMTFRTGYFVGARIEMRPRRIAQHYASTWLVVDLVIVIMEWVNRFAVAVGSASLLRSSRALRTLRFMKLFRVTKAQVFWKALQEQINSNVMHLFCTITILCGILLFTVHFVSCMWYAVGNSSHDGWTYTEEYDGEKSTVFWYVASIRWVISQFNGRTDMDKTRNMKERAFTCVVGIMLAVLAHAVFISVITKTMLDLSELVSEKTRRRRFVNEYLEANPLPPLLTSQVKRCLVDYHDVSQEVQTESKVLAILPQHVAADVLYEVRAPVLMENHFFRGLRYESPWAMRFVCRKVVQVVSANKYEVIFDKGDVCQRMLFMSKLTATYGQPTKERHRESLLGMSYTMVDNQHSSTSRWKTWKKRKQKPMESTETLRHVLQFVQSTDESGIITVKPGYWVSEAAVWSMWNNKGRLISNGHGMLLAVQADKLAEALKKHPDAFVLASIYGARLVEELLRGGGSDVLHWDVRLVSPITLAVTIVSASNLYNADGFFTGKSDPYCICNVLGVVAHGEARFKTDVKYDTLDPVWNYRAEIGLARHQSLEFQVWDHDYGTPHTDLGTARIESEDFYPHGFEGDLTLSGGNGHAQGSIRVIIEAIEQEPEPSRSFVRSGSITQKILQATRRPSLKSSSTSPSWDPVCLNSLGVSSRVSSKNSRGSSK